MEIIYIYQDTYKISFIIAAGIVIFILTFMILAVLMTSWDETPDEIFTPEIKKRTCNNLPAYKRFKF